MAKKQKTFEQLAINNWAHYDVPIIGAAVIRNEGVGYGFVNFRCYNACQFIQFFNLCEMPYECDVAIDFCWKTEPIPAKWTQL